MGVCFVAYSVSRENLALILADPPLVWRVLDTESDSSYLKQLAAANSVSLLRRLFGAPKAAPQPKSLSFSDGELRELDVDKAWDGLRLCIIDVSIKHDTPSPFGLSLSKPARASVQALRQAQGERSVVCHEFGKSQ